MGGSRRGRGRWRVGRWIGGLGISCRWGSRFEFVEWEQVGMIDWDEME